VSGASFYRWPNGSAEVPYVTSEWNPARRNPVTGIIQPHNGIDVIGFTFNEACASGVVTFARYNGGAGNEVRILHDDGRETRYKHNARILVRVGQRVSQGTPLGVMGSTGQSTGIHLHLETRETPSSPSMNPRIFMRARITLAGDGTPIQEDDMPLTKDDIEKIAHAVWREQLAHAGADTATNAATHLSYGRRDAGVAAARAADALAAAERAAKLAEEALTALRNLGGTVPSEPVGPLPALSDEDVNRIAAALATTLSRRLAD
jgi:hypothetical protein